MSIPILRSKSLLLAASVAAAFAAIPAAARILSVGPGKTYAKPSLAAAVAQKGDTVNIDAEVYESDACTWSKDNLVLRVTPGSGAGKRAHLKSNGTHSEGKGIWVVGGKNTTIDGIEFSGAKVPDGNGAGIRQEGPGVTIRNCYFHDNENGILADGGDMVIEYTEFAHNGLGDRGFTHNIYVSSATSFTLRHCYSHHAVIGHNVKSRAAKNFILYNRIMDEADGQSSYDIDLPNGGIAVIIGNVVQQGPQTDNSIVIAYGAEGLKHPVNEFYAVHNTVVNDRQGGTFFSVAGKPTIAKGFNNLFVGQGTPFSGAMTDTGGNVATQNPAFVDRAKYDYRLTSASPGIDKGMGPGSGGGISLAPGFHYVHPTAGAPRAASGKADAGAYELGAADPVAPRPGIAPRHGDAGGSRPHLGWSESEGNMIVTPAWAERPYDMLGARIPEGRAE